VTAPSYPAGTRAAYDAIAARYAALFSSDLADRPLDRTMVDAFAEPVRAAGPVADLGCGPGHVTAYLHTLGVDAYGVDLSPEMIAIARRAHPDLRYETGSMTELGVPGGSLGGILARYSLIHTPPGQVPAVLAEFHRLLAPGGHLLISFQTTDQPDGDIEPFDHKVAPAYRWPVDRLARALRPTGLQEVARLLRHPDDGERFLQATCCTADRPTADRPTAPAITNGRPRLCPR